MRRETEAWGENWYIRTVSLFFALFMSELRITSLHSCVTFGVKIIIIMIIINNTCIKKPVTFNINSLLYKYLPIHSLKSNNLLRVQKVGRAAPCYSPT